MQAPTCGLMCGALLESVARCYKEGGTTNQATEADCDGDPCRPNTCCSAPARGITRSFTGDDSIAGCRAGTNQLGYNFIDGIPEHGACDHMKLGRHNGSTWRLDPRSCAANFSSLGLHSCSLSGSTKGAFVLSQASG